MSIVQLPMACVRDAIPPALREEHFARIDRLFSEVALERREIAGGIAVRFPADAVEEVDRFIVHEGQCCPFLSISTQPEAAGDGSIWLRITGPDGASAFLTPQLPARRHDGES